MRSAKYRIGLICYSTQTNSIASMIQSSDCEVVLIQMVRKEREPNHWKRIRKVFSQLTKIDILYYGYGCTKVDIYLKLAKLLRRPVVSHWIGSDVLSAQEDPSSTRSAQPYISVNLAGSPRLKDELKAIGIDAKELPILPKRMDTPLGVPPHKHAAMAYLPKGREDFYGMNYFHHAAQVYPDVMFYVIKNDDDSLNLPNVKFLGLLSASEMDDLYMRTSIVIRLPQHDGLSLMLLEGLLRGKEVIYCYDFPGVRQVSTMNDFDQTMADIMSMPPRANIVGREWVLRNYDPEITRAELHATFASLLHEVAPESRSVD